MEKNIHITHMDRFGARIIASVKAAATNTDTTEADAMLVKNASVRVLGGRWTDAY